MSVQKRRAQAIRRRRAVVRLREKWDQIAARESAEMRDEVGVK